MGTIRGWRGRAAAGVAVVLAAVAASPMRPGPARADAPAFPDGHWSGDAELIGGAQYQNTVSYTITGGGCSFEMTIVSGKVTSGTIGCDGTTEGTVQLTGRALHVTTQEHADGQLTGTAEEVDGALTATVSGTVEGLGSGGPYTLPATAIIKPDTVDCGAASGDLAAHWRQEQQAAGMSSTEQAMFYAVRDSGTGAAGGGSGGVTASTRQFNKLMSDLTALSRQDPNKLGPDNYVLEVQRLADAADAYLSQVLARAHCTGGTPHLWQQDVLATAIQQAIAHAMIGPGSASFTVDQLGRLLVAGLQTDAVVPPRAGPGSENALWDVFEAELGKALAAAIAAGDQGTIVDIYVTATGADMTDLATRAKAAMRP